MQLAELCRRRIALLGFGREGRAIANLLSSHCERSDLTVWVESGAAPEQGPVIRSRFDERLGDFDLVLRSPGVPVDHPALVDYRSRGGQVVNPSSVWFAERPDVRVVGVTGSKGKSTTASLLAHLLRMAGEDVLLAGNIGNPLPAHIDTSATTAVVELSSYQLADIKGRLDLGIMTRLFDEHLDWHGDRLRYIDCKLRMVDLLNGRPLLINATDPLLREATVAVPGRIDGNRTPGFNRQGDRLYLDQMPLAGGGNLPLMGNHNLDNAALALEAAHLLGYNDVRQLLSSLHGFHALDHRLEPVETHCGRRWINDSIATSPHATLAALEALGGTPVVLIAGGLDRHADWQPVIDWCRRHELAELVVLPDNGPAIASAMVDAGVLAARSVHHAPDLEAAVRTASELAEPGATVLLSPGAPSFPHFRDFEQRGERFRAAVAAYSDRSTA